MNKKNAIYIAILIMLITISLWFVSLFRNRETVKKNNFDLELIDINNNIFTNSLNNKSIIAIFFNTQCDLCLNELEILSNNITELTGYYNIIFISFEGEKSLKFFFSQYSFENHNNIYIVSDEDEKLIQYFGILGYPSFIIFNSNGDFLYRGNILNEEMISNLLN